MGTIVLVVFGRGLIGCKVTGITFRQESHLSCRGVDGTKEIYAGKEGWRGVDSTKQPAAT